MTQLFLDTSSHNLIIAVYKDGNKIYELIEPANNKISDTLLLRIDETLKKASINIKEIDEIYAVTGPGSFTGIRIGLTFAKVTAYSLNIKTKAISELELLASGSNKKYTLSLIDARRGYVYAGMYDMDGNNILEDRYIYLNDLINIIKENYNLDDINIVSYDNFNILNVTKPTLDIKKIISKHKNDDFIAPHLLNPNYLKKTEAEEKLDDKRSNWWWFKRD